MNSPISPIDLQNWSDHTRVPFSVYTDPDIYRMELERIFYGPFWHPVALIANFVCTKWLGQFELIRECKQCAPKIAFGVL